MLASLVRISIQRRGIVVALALLLLVYGCWDLSRAGLDIFPEFAPKSVVIQTEAPGLAAEQVEILVTQPIENAIRGLIGLEHLRSESIQGLSIVTAIFNDATDIYRDRQLVSERLARVVKQLPEGLAPPVALPLASSSATVLTFGIRSDVLDPMQLRLRIDTTLLPRLLSMPGVADVNVFGGSVRQLQIQVLPDRLRQYGIGLDELAVAARVAAGAQGLGFIENSNQRFNIRIGQQSLRPDELSEVILFRRNGMSIRLRDVALVAFAPEPPTSAAAILGKRGIVMMVIGQYGANTLTVSRAVEAVLEEYRDALAREQIELYPSLFRPADYIERAVTNMAGHLLVGGVFVIVVLLLFLYNLRTALISVLAIPMSLLGAILVLLETGVSLNIMVLGGLGIALGEVVDDAIIDTENIFRRLRENRAAVEPRSLAAVVFDASMEVRGSVVYASFIVALVFVPLLTFGGVAGRLFAPLGMAYILAILISLLVALTLTPALSYLLLGRAQWMSGEPPLIARLKQVTTAALLRIHYYPRLAFTSGVAACAVSAVVLLGWGGRFLPELREGHYIVHTMSMPGTALPESLRIGGQLTEAFRRIPGVRSVSQWAGRAERGADTYGSHYSEYEVALAPLPGHEQQRIKDALHATLEAYPGIAAEVNTFLVERVDETISGYTSPIVINLYGTDLTSLDRAAQRVAQILKTVPGAVDVQVRSPPGTPYLDVQLNLDKLASWGLKPAAIMDALQIAFEGKVVGHGVDSNRLYPVSVVLAPSRRRQPADVAQLPIKTPDGSLIRLEQVADVRQSGGRYNVLHRDASRVQTVTCAVAGRTLTDFTDELRRRLHTDLPISGDLYYEVTGAEYERSAARQQLIMHALGAGVGVAILIYLSIGSFRHTLLMLVNLPFSMLGGVAAVAMTGASLSVGSFIGFVTLFGITIRNSIMLVSHYRHLVEIDRRPWELATAIQGMQERLPSILMTALVTALAMLPIALDSDNPGREIMGPMAAIIIGGLASSTVLNLLLLPSLLLRYGRFEHSQLHRQN